MYNYNYYVTCTCYMYIHVHIILQWNLSVVLGNQDSGHLALVYVTTSEIRTPLRTLWSVSTMERGSGTTIFVSRC